MQFGFTKQPRLHQAQPAEALALSAGPSMGRRVQSQSITHPAEHNYPKPLVAAPPHPKQRQIQKAAPCCQFLRWQFLNCVQVTQICQWC